MFCWTLPLYSMCFLPCPVFLSFFGIASIGLSCLVALFLYHVVFGIQYLGILNGVAAFVIVGIGELPLWHGGKGEKDVKIWTKGPHSGEGVGPGSMEGRAWILGG